jgi:hypothetical protein
MDAFEYSAIELAAYMEEKAADQKRRIGGPSQSDADAAREQGGRRVVGLHGGSLPSRLKGVG